MKCPDAFGCLSMRGRLWGKAVLSLTLGFAICQAFAQATAFGAEGENDGDDIPVVASIEVVKLEGAFAADVEVVFFDFPYHSIVDWGGPRREGSHFIIDAESIQIDFVQAPEEPLVEAHQYPLSLIDGDEDRFYTIEFRLNGLRLAEAAFSPSNHPPPGPAIWPKNVSLSAETGEDGETVVHVELEFEDDDFGLDLEAWEVPIRDGRYIVANVIVSRDDEDGESPVPGASQVFSHAYSFGNLPTGESYSFVMRINGEPAGRIFFVVGDDRPYDRWLADVMSRFNAEIANTFAYGIDDLNGSGRSNFHEYVMGLDPFNPADRTEIEASTIDHDGANHLAVIHRRRTDDSSLVYRVEVSNDLIQWLPAGGFCDTVERNAVSDEVEAVTLCLPDVLTGANARFFRVVGEIQ